MTGLRMTIKELEDNLQKSTALFFMAGLKDIYGDSGNTLLVMIELVSDKVLNVIVPKEIGLNALFNELSQLNIRVLSLKNKSNRLEQLFMDLIGSSSEGAV